MNLASLANQSSRKKRIESIPKLVMRVRLPSLASTKDLRTCTWVFLFSDLAPTPLRTRVVQPGFVIYNINTYDGDRTNPLIAPFVIPTGTKNRNQVVSLRSQVKTM